MSKNKNPTRKQHNSEVIQKLRSGEDLIRFDSYASWFPTRPTVSKDKKLMKTLYSAEPSDKKRVSISPSKGAGTSPLYILSKKPKISYDS